MTRLLFIWTIIFCSTNIFGQKVDITGIWKQPRAIHVRNYTFNNNGTFKHDEFGDLSEFHLTGQYTIRKDSIFLIYDTILDINIAYRKTKFPNDTLFIINKNVIKVNEYLYVFNEDRDDYTLTTDNNGVLNYKNKNFGDTIYLQHYVFYKWLTVDTFVSADSLFITIKDYQLPLHSGKNQFRIKSQYDNEYAKPFYVESNKDKINIDSKKVTDKIHFSGQTYYELYDSTGKLISKGTADTVDCSTLSRGNYILNYDNNWTEIKKI
jgi:hypothetical protein